MKRRTVYFIWMQIFHKNNFTELFFKMEKLFLLRLF